jgi:hypothetical protein
MNNVRYPKQTGTASSNVLITDRIISDSASMREQYRAVWDSSLTVYGHLSSEIREIKKRVIGLESRQHLCPFKIHDLNSDKYTIRQPIDVILKIVDDEYIALFPELEVYGEGNNEIYALNDLKDELIDLYEYLNSIPVASLGSMPKKWKSIVNSLIQKTDGD